MWEQGNLLLCRDAHVFARSLKQGWSWQQPGQEGARGYRGLPVPLRRLCRSPLPGLLSQRSLQSRAGKAPLPHTAEGVERLSCQLDTGENWCDKRDEKVVPCCETSLLSLLASFELRNLRWRDSAPDSPSAPPKPPLFSTGHLVLAAAALYLLFRFFMKCLQGIFLKSCNSTAGVWRALVLLPHRFSAKGKHGSVAYDGVGLWIEQQSSAGPGWATCGVSQLPGRASWTRWAANPARPCVCGSGSPTGMSQPTLGHLQLRVIRSQGFQSLKESSEDLEWALRKGWE